MSFKHSLAAAALIIPFAVATSAFAVDKPVDFVTKAGRAGMFEVKASQLALKKSKNPEIIAFAKEMIADHTAAAAGLKTAAKADKIYPPKVLDKDHQGKLNDLAKKGDDFDTAYINAQVDAHNDAVSLFDDYAKNGEDKSLKAFAGKTLPTLIAHRDHIDALDKKM